MTVHRIGTTRNARAIRVTVDHPYIGLAQYNGAHLPDMVNIDMEQFELLVLAVEEAKKTR